MSFELRDPRRDEDEPVDVDELRAEITIATDDAFRLADALAVEVVNCRMGNPAWRLAREYAEKRRYIIQLRAALKVGVAG